MLQQLLQACNRCCATHRLGVWPELWTQENLNCEKEGVRKMNAVASDWSNGAKVNHCYARWLKQNEGESGCELRGLCYEEVIGRVKSRLKARVKT
jgi:hypothetical protein